MTHLTVAGPRLPFTGTMYAVIAIVVIALGALARLRFSGSASEPISRTPYNNRHNDASAAREDHLG